MTANEAQQAQQQSRFKILRSEDNGKCATYELIEEDHTLGNALRHIILKNPEVKFCGYALPHPNERKINIQIQVYSGEAIDALEKGFRDLIELNNIVKEKILEAKEKFGPVELVDSDEEQDLIPEEEEVDDDSYEEGEAEVITEPEKTDKPGEGTATESAANQVPMISDEIW